MLRPSAALVLAAFSLAAGSASAPPSSRTPGFLVLTGTRTEGDAPGRFAETIDLAASRWKRAQQMGDSQSYAGFDGQPWGAANGIVTASNLPSAVAVKRAETWLEVSGWRLRASPGEQSRRVVPRGASPIVLAFDPTSGQVRQAATEGDWGIATVTFSDWRKVGPFTYPFRREELSPTGERVIMQAESAQLRTRLEKPDVSRPKRESHAQLEGNSAATIPFVGTGARKSHILVDANINGQPAKLIFDTGAANYVTAGAAPYFGIRPVGGINISGVGETSDVGGYATVDRVALGPAALRNETIVVGPAPWPEAAGKRPDVTGLTGYEFVAEYVTTIDYPARELRFATALPQQRGTVRVPFYNDEFHMYVHATVNGVDGLFGLDTGDGGTVTIFPAFAARAGIHGSAVPSGRAGAGIGGAVKAQSGTLTRFSLGGLDFDQLPVDFSQNKTGAFASRSIAGNLGGGVLQCFRITIDFPHHLLLFVPAPRSPYCAPGGTVRRTGAPS